MSLGLSSIRKSNIQCNKFEKELELFFNRCSKSLIHISELFANKKDISVLILLFTGLVFIFYYLIEILLYFIDFVINCFFKRNVRYSLYSKDSRDYKQYVNLWKPKKRTPYNIVTNINLEKRQKGKTVLSTTDYLARERNTITTSVNIIRTALIKNNFTLNGIVLETKFRKIDGDELLQYNATEELSSAYMKQIISFGDTLNNALKVILKGKVLFTTKKKTQKTYIVIEDGNLQELEKELGNLVGKDKVKIKLVQD